MAMSMSVTWTKGSTNTANNTSTATLTVKMTTTYGSYNLNGMPATVKVTGNATYSANQTWYIDLTQTKTMFTRTFTLNHDDDGTAKVTATVTCDTEVSSGVLKKTVSYTAPTIARASEPSVTSGTKYLGTAISINTNRKSSTFTHILKWNWAGKSGTIASNVGASYSWTPAIATFAPYLTDATSDSCKITCETYDDDNKIGSKTTSFALAIPTTVVPTLSSVTCSDGNGYLGTYGAYVQSKSDVKATVAATGIYGSTISSYTVTLDDVTANDESNVVDIGVPYNTGTRTVTATVVDTRGRTATKTTTITVAAYSAPDISASWAKRWNTSTNQEDDESGTVRVHAQGSVANVNSKGLNQGTVKIEYQLSTASAWTQKSNTTYTTSWNFNSDIANLSSNNAYRVRVTVTDSFGTVSTQTYVVETAKPILDFLYNGTGMAVGRVSSLQDVLDVQYKIKQHQPGYFTTLPGTSATAGYVRICRITNTAYYMNSSIGFVISNRNNTPTTVNMFFTNSATTDLVVKNAYSIGPADVYYAGSGNTFELWVEKTESYDHIALLDIIANPLHLAGFAWDLEGFFSATLPSGAVQITPWFQPQATDSDRILVSNHMALDNGIYLQGALASGTKTNILGINSSDQVELNWTTGGLKGRVMKRIWSGTASEGAKLTIPELGYYNLISMSQSDTNARILCPYPFFGVGGYAVNSTNRRIFFYSIQIGSMTSTGFTLVKATRISYDADANKSVEHGPINITGIWGIL